MSEFEQAMARARLRSSGNMKAEAPAQAPAPSLRSTSAKLGKELLMKAIKAIGDPYKKCKYSGRALILSVHKGRENGAAEELQNAKVAMEN